MDHVTIRTATLEDYEQLRTLEQRLIDAERPFDPTLKPTITYYDLQGMLTAPHIQVVVAEANGVIVSTGYGRIEKSNERYVHTQHLYVGFIYTDPAFRGRGLYEKIINEIRQFGESKGVEEVRLEVYAENIAAKRAYEKMGFVGHMLEMRLAPNKPS